MRIFNITNMRYIASCIAGCSLSAIGGGALYGHIILPLVSKKRTEAEQARIALQHAQEQEKLRTCYRAINAKYTTPENTINNSHALLAYKNELLADLKKLEAATEFAWDDKTEKDALIKFICSLKDHASKITKLIGVKATQEVYDRFKQEFDLIDKAGGHDASTMSTIIYEKYGDKPYKYSAYKNRFTSSNTTMRRAGRFTRNSTSP